MSPRTFFNMADLRQVLDEAGVRLAYLFGSRAQGQARTNSDYDVAVLLPDGLSNLERFDRAVTLETSLRKLIGEPLDLIVLNDAGPVLAFEAVIRGRLLLAYPVEEVFRYEQFVRQRYEDFSYSQRFFTAARRERLGLK